MNDRNMILTVLISSIIICAGIVVYYGVLEKHDVKETNVHITEYEAYITDDLTIDGKLIEKNDKYLNDRGWVDLKGNKYVITSMDGNSDDFSWYVVDVTFHTKYVDNIKDPYSNTYPFLFVWVSFVLDNGDTKEIFKGWRIAYDLLDMPAIVPDEDMHVTLYYLIPNTALDNTKDSIKFITHGWTDNTKH